MFDYNVSLQILDGLELSFNREKDTTATLEPRLTIYVGDAPALLKQLKLPGNIRAFGGDGGGLPGPPPVPSRKAWSILRACRAYHGKSLLSEFEREQSLHAALSILLFVFLLIIGRQV